MDESTIGGVKSLKLNDGGAPSRIQPSIVISVEGYDPSLQEFTLRLALTKHFSSCGRVAYVYVPRDSETGILKSVAFILISGIKGKDKDKDVLRKALELDGKPLELSGIDVGGWILIVKAAPLDTPLSDPYTPNQKQEDRRKVCVTGYDTSLPEIDLQIALSNHFSSCGEVFDVHVFKGRAYIILSGERCVENALKLSGSNMGGMNLVVDAVSSESIPRRRGPTLDSLSRCSVGYMPLWRLLEVKKEMEMKLKMEMVDEEKKEMMETHLMLAEQGIIKYMERSKKK